MLTIRRSIQTALLSLVAIGATACSKDSVSTSTTSRRAAAMWPASDTVYTQDFSGAIGNEWSNALATSAPSGEKFLGEFGPEGVNLTLNSLPAHATITLTVDLYILRSWDGLDPSWGTDAFTITADGETLLNSSFANNSDQLQNYPDAIGGATHPAMTGAFALGTLGFDYGTAGPFEDNGVEHQNDATYRLTFTFGHTASSLNLAFAAAALQDLLDESWGIDNVSVRIGQ